MFVNKVHSSFKKQLCICNSTFMALAFEIMYFKTVLIGKIFNPNYDFLVPFIWFKNIEKVLLQMTSGFLQLESTICM
jgi:hypothetical protein